MLWRRFRPCRPAALQVLVYRAVMCGGGWVVLGVNGLVGGAGGWGWMGRWCWVGLPCIRDPFKGSFWRRVASEGQGDSWAVPSSVTPSCCLLLCVLRSPLPLPSRLLS